MPAIVRIRTEILPDPANPQLLVHVDDDGGHHGMGETWWGTYRPELPPGAPVRAIAAFVDDLLAPLAVGHDADDIEGLWDVLHRATAQYGPEGVVSTAIAGIDLALWDLAGHRAGAPTSELLGPRCHDRIPAYASLTWYGDPAAAIDGARRAVDAGFRGVKLHERDPEVVLAVRDAIGPDPSLMLDVSARWTVEETEAAARTLAAADLAWIEEPIFPHQDHARLRHLVERLPQRLAAGENEFGLDGYRRLLDTGIGVFQPDPAKAGGLTPARRLPPLLEGRACWLCPHNFSLGPSLGANIHWAMTMDATTWLEVPFLADDAFPGPWRRPALDGDGCIPAPSGPGLAWS